MAKKENKKTEDNLQSLLTQIQSEYEVGYDFITPKVTEWQKRLKVYSNQRRKDADPEAIGDTTMFSVFQTLHASLYDGRMSVEFLGRTEGDEEVADNLTRTAEFDYTEMKKAEVDYDWNWNTLFFGRGLVSLEEFKREPDKGIFCPQPEVIDMFTWIRDPNAVSVHGNSAGKGAMRYGGREILMSKAEMEDHPSFFKDTKFEEMTQTFDTKSLLDSGKSARDLAQNRQTPKKGELGLGENTVYPVLEWYTTHGSKKVKAWLDGARNKIIGKKDCEDNEFPFVDKSLFITAGDWDGTSIPDLTEDKTRARAVMMNLAKKAMKSDIHPMYLFDEDKITNRNDLNFGFDKWIPAKGKGESIANAAHPLQRPVFNLGLLDFVYRSIELSAEKSTATSGIQQGALTEGDKTLGEIEAAEARSDVRFSLTAKVWGWAEENFWRMWYKRYKNNFADDIDKKVLRLIGPGGTEWRTLTKDQLTMDVDPDVHVENKAVIDMQDKKDRALLLQYYGFALQEQGTDRRYALNKLGRKFGLEKDELDRLFPQTVDEMIAEKENESLNEDSLSGVEIAKDQDHVVHKRIHEAAKDNSSTFAHIKAHEEAMLIKQSNPEFFNPTEAEAEFQPEEELRKPVAKEAIL